MKKISLACVFLLSLLNSLNAYEINGDLAVKWTGFKTEKKAPVSGTFNHIKVDIKSANDLTTFLKSSMVTIDSTSLESKNPLRNTNITSTLFALASAKTIKGSIVEVKESENKLTLALTMNELSKKIPMIYEMIDGKIIAKGSIDILDFNMKSSFLAFAQKCAALHQNKSFSDVNIEFIIPYK